MLENEEDASYLTGCILTRELVRVRGHPKEQNYIIRGAHGRDRGTTGGLLFAIQTGRGCLRHNYENEQCNELLRLVSHNEAERLFGNPQHIILSQKKDSNGGSPSSLLVLWCRGAFMKDLPRKKPGIDTSNTSSSISSTLTSNTQRSSGGGKIEPVLSMSGLNS